MGGVNEGDLPEGVKAGVHAPRGAEEPPGQSLAVIIDDVNRTLRGWFQYFQHSPRPTFIHLDAWVRMRLRSILRRRHRRLGRGRGRDHQRWPNAFFAAQGLYSLTTAHVASCQSVRR